MGTKYNGQEAYLHAYAASCFRWRCLICNKEAQDQLGIEEQFLGDGKVVFTDGIDGSKWVYCISCKSAITFNVSPDTQNNKLKPKDGLSNANLMSAKVIKVKQVTPLALQGRSTK